MDRALLRLKRSPSPRLHGRTARTVPSVPQCSLLGPGAILALAFWFGLATGLLELALLLATKPLHDPSPGFFRMNRHVVWIIPAFHLALFGALGGIGAWVSRRWPTFGPRLTLFLCVGLSALTVLLSVRKLHVWACLILASGVAYRVAPWLRKHAKRFLNVARWSLPLLTGVVLVLFGVAFDREALSRQRALERLPLADPDAPNVLLLVLDTVRADHMSLHGYSRDTTPNLVEWSRLGIRFDRAIAPAPWTLPSHASMFTGYWPFEHKAGLEGPLDDHFPTLAEFLGDHGYVSAGFIANTAYCTAETGIARGFHHYEDHELSLAGMIEETALGKRVVGQLWTAGRKASQLVFEPLDYLRGDGKPTKSAKRINGDFLDWLDTKKPDNRPFFAFLNYFDAHHPYILPNEDGRRRFGLRPESKQDYLTLHRWWSLDKPNLPAHDRNLAVDAYDDCIAYLDAQIGRLLNELERRGVLEDTWILITSDHGEHFGEHGVFCHGASLYQAEIGVPLAVIPPGSARARLVENQAVADAVSLRDLPATVADLLGLRANAPFPGRSLARFWSAPDTQVPETLVLSEIEGPARYTANQGRSPASIRGAMQALFGDDLVYIHSDDGTEELFDLRADPDQNENRADAPGFQVELERFRALRSRLSIPDPARESSPARTFP